MFTVRLYKETKEEMNKPDFTTSWNFEPGTPIVQMPSVFSRNTGLLRAGHYKITRSFIFPNLHKTNNLQHLFHFSCITWFKCVLKSGSSNEFLLKYFFIYKTIPIHVHEQ